MNKKQHVKWIAIGVVVVMVGYLAYFFMTKWPDMRRGFYAGYYSARGEVPPEFRDAVDYRFAVRLLPTGASQDTLFAGAERSALVLKPQYHHYEAFSSEEVYRKNPWGMAIVMTVAVLWVMMMVQVFLFLRDIRKGRIFEPVTIGRLRWVAWILMVIPVATFCWDKIYVNTVGALFAGSAYVVVDKIEFDSAVFVVGATLLLFVYLLKTGLEIKRESDLTI